MSDNPDPKLELVERAYRLELDTAEWLRELGTVLRSAVPGMLACYAFEVSRVDGRVTLGEHWADDSGVAEQLRRTFTEASNEVLDLFSSPPLLASMAGEVLTAAGLSVEATPLPDVFASSSIVDVFAVAATGPSGRGAVLGMCLDNHHGPAIAERVMLSQVGAHVAACTRLRGHLRGAAAHTQAEAILRPDGKIEHANAPSSAARELLPEAVKRVEQARRRGADTREALDLWQGLVAGRWSLVDHFEGSGRRYYVAIENPPQTARSRALTSREAQVVAYLASGTGTKSTAYALGLDVVTVRGYLRAAMAKLGVHTRAELIALRATLLADSSDDKN